MKLKFVKDTKMYITNRIIESDTKISHVNKIYYINLLK